jgi:hypothetical protein
VESQATVELVSVGSSKGVVIIQRFKLRVEHGSDGVNYTAAQMGHGWSEPHGLEHDT